MGCHSVGLDALVYNLFTFFEVLQLVVNRVALLHKLGDFLVDVLNLAIGVFTEFHNGPLLLDKYFLLVEVLFKLSPHGTLPILLIVHFTLLGLILELEIVQLLVKSIDFLFALQLEVVVLRIFRLLKRLSWHRGHHSFIRDIDFLLLVAPLCSHKLLVLRTVRPFGLVACVLSIHVGAIDLLAH